MKKSWSRYQDNGNAGKHSRGKARIIEDCWCIPKVLKIFPQYHAYVKAKKDLKLKWISVESQWETMKNKMVLCMVLNAKEMVPENNPSPVA